MYKTPLKSKVDKNKASFFLSLIVKPEQKIKFAFCNDLIIENSLYNPYNEHYFHYELLKEFWYNYNSNRRHLYSTINRHLKLDSSILNDCINNIMESTPMNRSSLTFLSNNLSKDHMYGAEISKNSNIEELPKLFYKTNKVTDLKSTKDFTPDETFTFLECLSCDSQLKNNHSYFLNIINHSGDVCVLTDQSAFKGRFERQIHINDNYYLCYDKETL